MNRRRATIDLIEKSESSEHYRNISAVFRDHFTGDDASEKLEKLHDPSSEDEKNARRKVQQFLNHYELICIGIIGNSLHEKTYRAWMMSVVVRDWNRAAEYIQRERWKFDKDQKTWSYHPSVYRGFETLALRWAKKCKLKATRINQNSTKPPIKPTGPGDEAIPREDNDPCDTADSIAASNPFTDETPSTP